MKARAPCPAQIVPQSASLQADVSRN